MAGAGESVSEASASRNLSVSTQDNFDPSGLPTTEIRSNFEGLGELPYEYHSRVLDPNNDRFHKFPKIWDKEVWAAPGGSGTQGTILGLGRPGFKIVPYLSQPLPHTGGYGFYEARGAIGAIGGHRGLFEIGVNRIIGGRTVVVHRSFRLGPY